MAGAPVQCMMYQAIKKLPFASSLTKDAYVYTEVPNLKLMQAA